MLAQAASICAMITAVRYLSFYGYSGPQLVFFRGCMGLIVLLPWLVHSAIVHPKIFLPKPWNFVIYRTFLAVAGIFCWFFALTGIPISDVVAIQFTHPLFVVIGASLILRETVDFRRWCAVFLGFIGMLIIIRPGFLPLILMVWAILLSAFCNAGVQLITKHVAQDVSGPVLILYMNLLMAPTALYFAYPVWIWPEWYHWGGIFAVGLFGTTAHIFLARGLKIADASLLGTVDFMRLPLAAVFGWVMFNEFSDIWTWFGATIIFFAVLVTVRRGVA